MKICNVLLNLFALIVLSHGLSLDSTADTGPLGYGTAEWTQEMEIDRPDFTEGAQTVQAGHLQFELGYSFTTDDDSDADEHGVPESLLRVGLIPDLELRIGWGGYRDLEVGDESTDGYGDMSVGVKHHMYDQDGWLPELSFLAALSLPTGSADFKQDDVGPEFKIIWAYDLDLPFSIGGNINHAAPKEEDKRYFEPSYSFVAGFDLTDDIGSYIEYFAFFPDSDAPSSQNNHFLNGGLIFGVTDSLKFDLSAGLGLNDEADDFFAGCGVSFRI